MDYETEHPYQSYDPNFNPDELMMRLHQLQSRIASTVTNVTREMGSITEKQSQILQTVDEIQLSVLQITTGLEANRTDIASLTIKADSIESNVVAIDSRIGAAESAIIQNATSISSMVSLTDFTGQRIASLITQDAIAINMIASEINLAGYVTFASLSTPGATAIDGANITTGRITALDWISFNDQKPFDVYVGGLTHRSARVYNGSLRLEKDGVQYAEISELNGFLYKGNPVGGGTAKFG